MYKLKALTIHWLLLVLSINIAYAQIITGWETHNYLQDKFVRKFSKFSKQGELTKVVFPLLATSKNRYVIIDDKTYELTPGIRFYSPKNQLIIPPSTITTPIEIAYIEINGAVSRIWILTKEEADNFKNLKFK